MGVTINAYNHMHNILRILQDIHLNLAQAIRKCAEIKLSYDLKSDDLSDDILGVGGDLVPSSPGSFHFLGSFRYSSLKNTCFAFIQNIATVQVFVNFQKFSQNLCT